MPGHHRVAAERGHRARTRSAFLDRHTQPQRVGPAEGGPDTARGDELGPVVRPVSGAPVPQDLPLRQLAPLVDFGTGNLGDVACHALHIFYEELEMGAPDWVAADACQACTIDGRVANSECNSIANYVQWHFPARGKHPEMMAYFYDGACSRRGR